MPSFRCRHCDAGYYSEARAQDTPGGFQCDACGGRLVERRRSPEDLQVGNVLYPAALRDVQAAPVDRPGPGRVR